MNTSLRDQLLAAGLVTEKQARQARQQEERRQQQQRHQQPRQEQPRHGAPVKATPSLAAQAQAAKAAQDAELNRRRHEKAERKARLAQIDRLVEQNRLPRLETEDFFSFVDGKKVRRMAVDVPRREQLMRGELMIVRFRGFYAVVPAAVAEQVRERDATMIVPITSPQSAPQSAPQAASQEDPYKDFVVPDDLMW
ncbi:MAG TPA: DUF2058 domain-containing protein [Steroidobacteraceae bacterium]|nr:DUF2058 domain-containing protein [Steroidobacteraceae bacterium]